MSLKFTGTFEELEKRLSPLELSWEENQAGKKVTRKYEGVLNWFESTGTIQFQGQPEGKAQLEAQVKHTLYPNEYEKPSQESTTEQPDTTTNISDSSGDSSENYPYSEHTNSEIVIGIVSAVGTQINRVTDPFCNHLKQFGYEVEEIRVSKLLNNGQNIDNTKEYDRIKKLIDAGDLMREKNADNSILAAGAIRNISEKRNANSPKIAYLVNSLKHPEEVTLLRKVYGHGFFLVGIHSDEKRRTKYLMSEKGLKEKEAAELIKIDEDEAVDHGQRTRDTYHLSDIFINLGKNEDQITNTVKRFLELLFAHPYKNPTFDEFAMFMAFNSSIRSSDLSRQVGAVITKENQIIATGANDSPKFGGGQYWAEVDSKTGEINDKDGGKDHTLELDSNIAEQRKIIQSIVEKAKDECVISDDNEEKLHKILENSRISDLTEFGRAVHAEMDALLSCSREGIKTIGATLYCTTFPCHNCAKHIINAGIKRVVYVEPYPKSKALELHSDSIYLKTELDAEIDENLIAFEPFTGIGTRRFLDLFSMTLGVGNRLRRKDGNGDIINWSRDNATLRVSLINKNYTELEKVAITKFDNGS